MYTRQLQLPTSDYVPRIGTAATVFTTSRNECWYQVFGDVVDLHVNIVVSNTNSPTDTGGNAVIRVDLPVLPRAGYTGVGVVQVTNINFAEIGLLTATVGSLPWLTINQSLAGTGDALVLHTDVAGNNFSLQGNVRYRI